MCALAGLHGGSGTTANLRCYRHQSRWKDLASQDHVCQQLGHARTSGCPVQQFPQQCEPQRQESQQCIPCGRRSASLSSFRRLWDEYRHPRCTQFGMEAGDGVEREGRPEVVDRNLRSRCDFSTISTFICKIQLRSFNNLFRTKTSRPGNHSVELVQLRPLHWRRISPWSRSRPREHHSCCCQRGHFAALRSASCGCAQDIGGGHFDIEVDEGLGEEHAGRGASSCNAQPRGQRQESAADLPRS